MSKYSIVVQRKRAQGHPVLVQFGCGPNGLDGWINTDKAQIDITKRLPFDDNSVDVIYLEHVIEHISPGEGLRFLRECRRILIPGRGVVRVAFPDLIRVWNMADDEYVDFVGNKFGADIAQGIIDRHLHMAVWTKETMEIAMMSCGFEVSQWDIGDSDNPYLRGVEQHVRMVGHRFNEIETCILEGARPKFYERTMRVAMVKHENEPMHSKCELEEYGYEPVCFYDDSGMNLLATILSPEQLEWLGGRRTPAECNTFENSLRANWIHMLESAPEDIRIFCESDAAPSIASDKLEELLAGFEGLDDYDVVRLFFKKTQRPDVYAANDMIAVQLDAMKADPKKSLWRSIGYGTHALYIPPIKRKKAIEVFKTTPLPVDAALEYMAAVGSLRVGSCSRNLFYQKSHLGSHLRRVDGYVRPTV